MRLRAAETRLTIIAERFYSPLRDECIHMLPALCQVVRYPTRSTASTSLFLVMPPAVAPDHLRGAPDHHMDFLTPQSPVKFDSLTARTAPSALPDFTPSYPLV